MALLNGKAVLREGSKNVLLAGVDDAGGDKNGTRLS